VLDHERRRPGRYLVPVATPDLLPGVLVEGDHEGVVLVIPDDEHAVAVQRRRTPLAETEPGPHVAEVAAPKLVAIEIERVEALRTEESDQHLAVRDRRSGGPGAVGMGASRGRLRTHGPLPNGRPARAVQRVDLVAQDLVR